MGGRDVAPTAGMGRSSADPDSRARTHLANERTFLAWLRTGLSLVAVGLAAAGLLPEHIVPGLPIVTLTSLVLILLGTALVLLGATRYVRAHRQIENASYLPTVWPMIAVALVLAIFAVLAMPLVILLR